MRGSSNQPKLNITHPPIKSDAQGKKEKRTHPMNQPTQIGQHRELYPSPNRMHRRNLDISMHDARSLPRLHRERARHVLEIFQLGDAGSHDASEWVVLGDRDLIEVAGPNFLREGNGRVSSMVRWREGEKGVSHPDSDFVDLSGNLLCSFREPFSVE